MTPGDVQLNGGGGGGGSGGDGAGGGGGGGGGAEGGEGKLGGDGVGQGGGIGSTTSAFTTAPSLTKLRLGMAAGPAVTALLGLVSCSILRAARGAQSRRGR